MQSPLAMLDDLATLESEVLISSQTDTRERVKVINDPIHGHFQISGLILNTIDTPHVQRLRDLKQLGSTYLVYPGASHNRFEHSLGVCHLSSSLVSSLYSNPRDPDTHALFENERQFNHSVNLVSLAGLCHDLGHGPYSHLFDHQFLPAAFKARRLKPEHAPLLHHEARSVKLFEHLVDKFHIDIHRSDARLIGDLITGSATHHSLDDGGPIPNFLFDVVANSKTGIDTDKFDYLARDVYNVGLQGAYGFDHRRLIQFAKVVGNDICYHRKEIFNVYHLFLTRFQLHRTVYNHPAALSIDAMVNDAFLEADRTLEISDSISDPEAFLTMTDSIIPIIERSKESSLANARRIIRRLRCRRLYRFVDEFLVPAGTKLQISPEDITTWQDASGTGVNLVPDDIHVAHVKLNFGMKDKNPVDKVLFFQDWEDRNPVHISSAKASYVIPAHFEEIIIRVFVKREERPGDTNRIKDAVKTAFRRLLKTTSHSQPDRSLAPIMRRHTGENVATSISDQGEGLDGLTSTDSMVCQGKVGSSMETTADDRVAKRKKPIV